MSTELCIVLVTAPSTEKASEMATVLVEERLCACINVIPIHESVYQWEGKLCRETEALMIIKCAKHSIESLEARVKEIHPYDVPEFVVLKTKHVSKQYLQWALGLRA